MRKEALDLLEAQSRQGSIDLFFGDEGQVSPEGYVPYGWQFADEQVCMASGKGKGLNCFALINRGNQAHYRTGMDNITAAFVVSQLEGPSLSIEKPTVAVLDNARVHTAEKVKERLRCWQQRGLFLFYLPPYPPHLNLAERPWKELKARWPRLQGYLTLDNLFYAVNLALAAVGKQIFINF